MAEYRSATMDEILSQPDAWRDAIRAVKEKQTEVENLPWESYTQVIFTGCGSTYYLSLSAAALFQSLTGKDSRAFPASELLLFPSSVYPRSPGKTLLVAVSRSGTTTETLKAVGEYLEAGYGDLITVSNYEDSPLAAMGNINVTIPFGKERSVAQTRSFASMFVACTALAVFVSGEEPLGEELNQLASIGTRLLTSYDELARRVGEDRDIQRFYFLGSGIQFGLASEASLKMKEMTLSESEPFHSLEFRHGPISMVDDRTCLVGLLSSEHYLDEIKVIEDAKRYGVRSLTLGETQADVSFKSGIPEPIRGVLYLPVLQLLAYYRAISFGLDPDKPRHLTAVVQLS